MKTLWQDIRYGVRMLRKSPGLTSVAVLTLALGIGANAAIFTLIEALLLKSLPVQDPQQLATVTVSHPGFGRWSSFSYPLYQQWRDNLRSFSGLIAATGTIRYNMTLEGKADSEPGRVGAQAVSGNYFTVLGVPALLGRTLTPEDDRPGVPEAVAVISYGLWQRCFGLDPLVIGRTIRLENAAVTIVGVTGRDFFGWEVGSRSDLWLPLQAMPLIEGEGRARALASDSQWLRILGRLSPGVRAEQARAELDVGFQQIVNQRSAGLARVLSEKDLQEFRKQWIELETGGTGYSTLHWELRQPLLILLAIVSLVLLVACANLAGLLLARGVARQHEFSVRAALGAGRRTLIRQLVTESLLLTLIGGALGLVLAQWGARLLAYYIVPHFGESFLLDLGVDPRVLAFTFALCALAAVLFGLIPAWRSSRLDLATTLKNQTGASSSLSGSFGHKVLVVSQIAVSCCLLVGAGLFVRTVQKLKSLDLGINRENLLAFQLDLGRGYDSARRANLYRELFPRLESLPGVRSVCCSSLQSLGGSERSWGPNKVVPQGSDRSVDEGLAVNGTGVTRNYFATMGIPLLCGRDFGPQDEAVVAADPSSAAPRPVIIDETAARQLFGAENPVGRFLQADGSGPLLEVIGVAREVVHKRLRDGPRMSTYSLAAPERVLGFFYVRTLGHPLAVAGGIRRVVRELDPKVEVAGLQTMTHLINQQLFRERSLSSLAGFFSLLALVLACLGLYGTLSYSVVRRTREIGVRMALGARRQTVLSLVVRQGLKLVLIGIGIGLGAALALTRLVSSLLYDVAPTDPAAFAGASLLLLVVSLIACGLPARRAARIDPMVALRYE